MAVKPHEGVALSKATMEADLEKITDPALAAKTRLQLAFNEVWMDWIRAHKADARALAEAVALFCSDLLVEMAFNAGGRKPENCHQILAGTLDYIKDDAKRQLDLFLGDDPRAHTVEVDMTPDA